MRLADLSVTEIRERFVRGDGRLTAHVIRQLRHDPREGVRQIGALLARRHARERDARARLDGLLNFERVLWKTGVRWVAGVDESGMGPLAGPVVAAAVVFAPDAANIPGVDDSKKLEPAERERLAATIRADAAAVAIGVADVGDIDRLNIYQAGLLAMRRAIDALGVRPQHVLVDARTIPDLDVPQNGFSRGDGLNFSIAAASIVAKTERDRRMLDLDRQYPEYGFARHKGYGTAEHMAAVRRHGPCPVHRLSFPVIRELCGEFSAPFYELKHRLETAGSEEALRALDAELDAQRTRLADAEHRKLRIMLGRKWKVLDEAC